jgi:type I restriction enzyme M protein
MSSNISGEGSIRMNIVEADLVDCIVSLPNQLFYNTMIPACLWFIARDKKNHKFRDRSGDVLFIDARKMGILIDRRHRELTDEEIQIIAHKYHAWRGELDGYEDAGGFCKSVRLDEIRQQGRVLTPGRYVGTERSEEDGEPFEQKMRRLTSEILRLFKESQEFERRIQENLESLDLGV